MGIIETIGEAAGSAAYQVKRAAMYVTGKGTITGIASGLPQSMVMVGAVGVASAVSASLAQMDYIRKNRGLITLYQDELEAKLGAKGHKLTKKDLQILAEGDLPNGVEPNGVIAEAVNKNRKERNIGVVLSVLATVTAIGLVGLAGSYGMFDGMHGAAEWIAHGAAGLLTYNAVKAPLHWVADKVFDMDKRTVHDRIASITKDHLRGKTISREQVFSVFANANPELNEMIKSRFGKKFSALKTSQKQQIAREMGRLMNIDELTAQINAGQMRPTELAFAAQGQVSGVTHGITHEQPEKKGLLSSIVHAVTHPFQGAEPPSEAEHVEQMVAQLLQQEKTGQSFVSRLGRRPKTTDVTHVENLDARGDLGPVQR